VVLDRVVQQGGHDHIDVCHIVVGDDADRGAQQMVDVGFPGSPVEAVQFAGQAQCLIEPVAVGPVEFLDFQREPLS
jgi:hypothetical protein